MAVADHVDVDRLLASSSDEFDHRNASMIDGRAVQHTLMFIEPHLVEQYPAAIWKKEDLHQGEPFGSVIVGGLSCWKRARFELQRCEIPMPSLDSKVQFPIDGVLPLELLELLELERGGNTPDGLRPAEKEAVRSFEDAMGILSRFGLAYFVELAIGIVIIGKEASSDVFDVPYVSVCSMAGSPLEMAERLLERAAGQLMWQWIEVEMLLNAPHEPRRDHARFGELIALFADSVLTEFRRRAEALVDEEGRQRDASLRAALQKRAVGLLAWLDSFRTTPLTQELLSCWYPGWRRSLFIYNSPFDPMNCLKPVESEVSNALG